MAGTRASKSQLYHYFGDKRGLVEAVVEHQSEDRARRALKRFRDNHRGYEGRSA
jgi:AcrR family transcriptional regulator